MIIRNIMIKKNIPKIPIIPSLPMNPIFPRSPNPPNPFKTGTLNIKITSQILNNNLKVSMI